MNNNFSENLFLSYKKMIEESKKHLSEGWRPVHGEILKINHNPTNDQILNFRNYYFSGFGLDRKDYNLDLETASDMEGKKKEYDNIDKNLIYDFFTKTSDIVKNTLANYYVKWINLLIDPIELGGPRGFISIEFDDGKKIVPVSRYSIQMALRSVMMFSVFFKFRNQIGFGMKSRVMEIGGGTGHSVRNLAMLMPRAKFVVVDLPFNLVVTHAYLEKMFPGEVGRFWSEHDVFDAEKRFFTVSPWKIFELSEIVELCINFRSFQHMDIVNLKYYLKAFEKLNVKSIYHVNRNMTRDDTDVLISNYPFRKRYKQVMSAILPYERHSMRVGEVDTPFYMLEELLVEENTLNSSM